jgi:two-component sensor histidine kinase
VAKGRRPCSCGSRDSPSAAQQFALIIHELAIEGKIERLDESGLFSFRWRETGGPPPSLPTRKGFGSVVLLDSVQHFARTVAMNFENRA